MTSSDARAIVETIISLAQTLKMQTVAEGVENRAQPDVLGAHGCDLIQGFLMSKLLALDESAFAAAWSPHETVLGQRNRARALRSTLLR